jgi:MATE family multidrug resistance protein
MEPGTLRLGEEIRALLRLAIPVVLSELAWMMMSVVDTIMVGRLSPEAIGAVGLSNALYHIPTLFGIGLVLGLDTLVSQAYGRRDLDDCRLWLIQALYIVLVLSPLMMAIVYSIPAMLPLWHTNRTVATPTITYLRLLNWGTPWLLAYASFRRYLQGMGVVKPVTFAIISANLVNLLGNWVLIYGKFGLPAMGVRGSALSTVVARIYMATFLFAVAVWHERKRGFSFFVHWHRPTWQRVRRIFQLGFPAATQMIFEIGAFGASTILVARLNPETSAAHQVALNCTGVAYMVPLGISAAAAVAVGHAIGAGDPARARRTGWIAIGLAFIFMTFMAVLLTLFPYAIVHIYSHDSRVLAIGAPLLALAAAFQVFDGVQIVATGALRGCGHTKAPMALNLIGYWVFGLPLGYTLCFYAKFGVYGIWIGLTLALVLIAIFVLFEWKRASNRRVLLQWHDTIHQPI